MGSEVREEDLYVPAEDVKIKFNYLENSIYCIIPFSTYPTTLCLLKISLFLTYSSALTFQLRISPCGLDGKNLPTVQ